MIGQIVKYIRDDKEYVAYIYDESDEHYFGFIGRDVTTVQLSKNKLLLLTMVEQLKLYNDLFADYFPPSQLKI